MKKSIIIILGCLFAFCSLQGYAQSITVTGKVLDEFNEGLPGASVIIKGTNNGTITDLDGKYTLSVPSSKSVLKVSFVGYKIAEEIVGKRKNIDIHMKNDAILDEVIVVGYGKQKKINATGAVKTIDNSILESRPVGNVAQGLQGRIAGLNITNDNGGGLGEKMSINIRGIGSIEGSSAPLVLIDGMEGDISTINPNDIESYSVLKDAASASIYGSRAPFGVILITTKSGERGLSVSYKGNLRFSQPVSVPDMVDSHTYALMVNDAFINSASNPPFGAGQLARILRYQQGEALHGIEKNPNNNTWNAGDMSFANTDWYDVFLKKHTTAQEHNMTITGGGEKVTYYFSANYMGQTGLFNFADETYSRLSMNGKVGVKFNKYVEMNWNSRLANTENDKPTALNDLFFHNLGRRSPLYPLYMPNGEYGHQSLIPAMLDGGRNINKTQTLSNQLSFIITPIKGWKIHADINSRLENPRGTRQFSKLTYVLPDGSRENLPVLEGVAGKFEDTAKNGSFQIQPAAGQTVYEKTLGYGNFFSTNLFTDYEKKVKEHYFKVLVGMQTEHYYSETNRVASTDILLNDRPYIPSGNTQKLVSERKGEWSSIGFFGRLNYNYAERYLVELNLRYDGASRFPTDKRWALFPTFSLGWNIAQEKFWAPLANAGFEYLKVRGSYGSLGNQNTPGYYDFYQQMNSKSGSVVLGGEQATILPVYDPFSTDLTWMSVENIGVGLDFGFFRNRLTGSFDIYQRSTLNMLGPSISLPALYGGAAPRTNSADLRTRGWEVELGWRDNVNKNFSYAISATLSDYKSVITRYESPDNNIDKWYTGKTFGDLWGYQVIGIAKSDKEMTDYLAKHSQAQIGSNWGGGDIMYRDLDNDGTVSSGSNTLDNHGDLSVIGNSTPRYAYSFSLEATYKFIDVKAFFQGIGKRDLYFKGSATFFGSVAPYQRSLYTAHLDYFRYAGETLGGNLDPYYARIRTDQNNSQVSDRYLQDGSYLRLKNLQIGFSLPKNTKLNRYVKNARVYFSGENLLTFTKLRIYDPEAVGDPVNNAYGPGKAYPMYRVWSAGLELTF